MHIVRDLYRDGGIHVKCSRDIAPRIEGNPNHWIVVDGRGRILIGGGKHSSEFEALAYVLLNK